MKCNPWGWGRGPFGAAKVTWNCGSDPQHHSKEVCWCPPAVPELRWRQEDQKLQVILGFILEAELRYMKALPQKIFFFILKFILYVCSIFIQCLESSPGPRICPASVLPLSYMPSPALPITGENHKPFSVTNEWMGGQVWRFPLRMRSACRRH